MTKGSLYVIIGLSFLMFLAGISFSLNAQSAPPTELPTSAGDQEFRKIDHIWTIDNRPDSVEIHWILPNLDGEVDCRVQRWEINESNFTNVRILNREISPVNDEFTFLDTTAKDTTIEYGYKIWIMQDSFVYVSDEAFTVPKPSIKEWGDYHRQSDSAIFTNCLNDTIIIEQIDFTEPVPWHIDSVSVQAIINSNKFESSWQEADNSTCIFNMELNSDGAAHVDSMICEYAVIAKDQTGNTSRISNSRKAIIDISPPAIGKFSVAPNVNSSDSTSDGSIMITIKDLQDKISGLKYFQLYRKTTEQTNYELIGHYTTTSDLISIVDSSSNFEKRTLLDYRLRARDNVNNEDIIADSSVRCLLPPEITLAEHETTADSVEIASWNNYDITDVRHFEVMINDKILDTLINTDCNKIQLPEIGENRIKIRSAFLKVDGYDIVYSEWAEGDTVTRMYKPVTKINWVIVDHDTNFDTMHEGNLELTWEVDSAFDGKFAIFRTSTDEEHVWIATVEKSVAAKEVVAW
ncbi:MAG: hypothetical protein GF353_07080, partial [Candidatus Lokiarchaeota archaeon]|nr:hypothetical protein [Candidatus Lokiarchaeota archaeon]